jgi:hypothetical protein
MITEIYDAFAAAGTPDEKARKAAEIMSEVNQKQTQLNHDYQRAHGDLRQDHVRLDGRLNTLTWMSGFNITLSLLLLGKLFLAHQS